MADRPGEARARLAEGVRTLGIVDGPDGHPAITFAAWADVATVLDERATLQLELDAAEAERDELHARLQPHATALRLAEAFARLPVPLNTVERAEWMTAKGRALGAIEGTRLQHHEQDSGGARGARVEVAEMSGTQTTLAWLIERGQSEGQDPPLYFCSRAESPFIHPNWTKVAHHAFMFSSRVEAERYIEYRGLTNCRAVEHGFMAPDEGPGGTTLRRASEEIACPYCAALDRILEQADPGDAEPSYTIWVTLPCGHRGKWSQMFPNERREFECRLNSCGECDRDAF